MRDSTVYNGNQISNRYQTQWSGSYWDKRRTEYIYDSNNYLIQENHYGEANLGGWWHHRKILYTNDVNGIITEKQYYNLYGNVWDLSLIEQYAAWHIANKLPASYTSNSNGLQQFTINLGSNGSKTTTVKIFDPSDSTWKVRFRETSTNDSRGNFINNKSEMFDQATRTWETTGEYGNRYTYNQYFDIIECIQYWSEPNQRPLVIKDRFKTVYSGFQYFGQIPEKVVTLYPNPTEYFLNIDLESEEEALQVNVIDLAGKVRLNKSFTSTEAKKLNLEELPKGIYLLQLQTEAGSVTKRIVKQ